MVPKFLGRCFVSFVIFGFVCYLSYFPIQTSSRIDGCVCEHSRMDINLNQGLFVEMVHLSMTLNVDRQSSTFLNNPEVIPMCKCHTRWKSNSPYFTHTQQRQWPMRVNGDTWEWVWDRFSSVTIHKHWLLPLPLTLGVVRPLRSIHTVRQRLRQRQRNKWIPL